MGLTWPGYIITTGLSYVIQDWEFKIPDTVSYYRNMDSESWELQFPEASDSFMRRLIGNNYCCYQQLLRKQEGSWRS